MVIVVAVAGVARTRDAAVDSTSIADVRRLARHYIRNGLQHLQLGGLGKGQQAFGVMIGHASCRETDASGRQQGAPTPT